MLEIEAVNHVGIRVRDKARSISFYETLGFALINDAGFEEGHPVILRHTSRVTHRRQPVADRAVAATAVARVGEVATR